MRTCKKLLTIFLIISLALVMMLPASALSAEKTTQEKAQTLGALKIISGTNGQFSLGNQVTRAEAVTFIVKTIGKANDVNANKDFYRATPFTDVPSTSWYAPFIGYCFENGFFSNAGSEFKPLGFITEKEFLRLVLIALDFKDGTDFTADTVYDKARDLGLISLNDYISHINLNTIPTRGSAVEILYAALKTSCREGGKLAQKLIDAGVTSRVELMALELVNDTTAAAISQVKITGPDSMEIKLSEAATGVSSVRIYSKSNANDSLPCSIQAVSGDTVVLNVSNVTVNKEYVVELTNVLDTEGNRTGRISMTFTGSEPQEIVSNFFRIRKIEPVNSGSIKVYFTHPVTINSEVCLYYSVLKDNAVIADGKLGAVKAGLMNSDKTGVLLTLDSNTLNKGDVYTLKIDGGMMSSYGVRLNDGAGDTMKFVAREDTESKFALNQISAVDKRTLLLSFNKEVNPFLASQIYNFYVTDANNSPIRINSSAIDPNGCSVYLNLGQDVEKGKKYNLIINNINDITKQEYITEESYPFTADYGSASKFEITGIHITDSQTIDVYFNKALDKETAMKIENCSILRSGSYVRPDRLLYDPGNNQFMLTVYLSKANSLTSQYTYEVQLNGMKDNLGNSLDNARVSFGGANIDKKDIAVNEVVPVSSDAVKVTFTRDIAYGAPNLLTSNYVLEYGYNKIAVKKAPICVIYIDSKTLVLKFDSLESNVAYKLKTNNITDYSGATVKGQDNTFQLRK